MLKTFREKVAVITGAASGIGRALAERCATEGMKVVLADINEQALMKVNQDLVSHGVQTLAVPTDVSQAGDVEMLARKTFEAFSKVHLLFNNAGVGPGKTAWESTLQDWKWILGVNLWGVIHGIHYFLPHMLDQKSDGHVVNTSSTAGLLSGPSQTIYKVSKHCVVSLSETLYYDLAVRGANIKVSVLCPGVVNTNILDAKLNRPASLQNAEEAESVSSKNEALKRQIQQAFQKGMVPEQVANKVFEAIYKEQFYILTHPELKKFIATRMEDILQERNPALPKIPALHKEGE